MHYAQCANLYGGQGMLIQPHIEEFTRLARVTPFFVETLGGPFCSRRCLVHMSRVEQLQISELSHDALSIIFRPSSSFIISDAACVWLIVDGVITSKTCCAVM